MFSTELGFTFEAAYREAVKRRHAYFCVEHILYALLFDEQCVEVIEKCGGDVAALKIQLEQFFNDHIETTTPVTIERGKAKSHKEAAEGPVQTPAVDRVLHAAIVHMRSAGLEKITAREMFVAIFSEEDSHAVATLARQQITKLDVLNFIAHGIEKMRDEESEDEVSAEADDEDDADAARPSRGLLGTFTEDVSAQAERGELDPVIGREREVERALKILARRQKNNPLFIGDPGVGKTAMASALAQRIVAGQVPERLKGARIYSLNVGSLVAGTKFRGEFEERLRKIVAELVAKNNAILFIDEIHQLVGAGATGTGSMDAANLLKPALSAGKLRCIGSTTHEDFKKSFEKDRALSRRFSTIDISEPSVVETVQILKGLKGHFESYHGVRYSEASLKAAAELSAKHITERFLPDKAIDVVDEAGAANNLLPAARRKRTISEREIEGVVSAIARVPVKSVSNDDEGTLRGLEASLKARVFGQEAAVSAVAQAIKRSRASLKADNKPIGCFLFAGPTGVGKTELAKALAQVLGVHFHRFDMTEYMEKHAVARLIGAPPGYVGYEEGGQLSDLIRRQPYAVLLFDEIEKAHEDIYNILLQVMDDAILTDSKGRKVDFRNVILIMTTNAGSEKASAIGFGQSQSDTNRESAIKKLFKPEFRNRLDEVIYFGALPAAVIREIVDKFIHELSGQLRDRKISFSLDDEAREYLASKGFDPLLGARPMARVIQREIKDSLADEILFGKLKKGGKVQIGYAHKKLTFDIRSAE